MIKKVLTSKRGEMYIEGVVTVMVVVALLVFSLSVLQIATLSNTADTIADQLIETATFYGSFGTEYEAVKADLEETYNGMSFEVSENAPGGYFNSTFKRVQLGDTMTVTVKYNFTFGGFGSFLTIPLQSVRTGASENYWKIT